MQKCLWHTACSKHGCPWLCRLFCDADNIRQAEQNRLYIYKKPRQYRTIPALRLKHRSGSCGTASALPKCSIRHPVLSALLAWHLPHLARRIGT
ncbi:hypothetical protein [Gemmiger sp.]|uniref:hypothetical protein n=1 Tax=Gemmiger sp. TaxID=2049027 RepID=UPI00344BAC4A